MKPAVIFSLHCRLMDQTLLPLKAKTKLKQTDKLTTLF